jgi:hypothetical protein
VNLTSDLDSYTNGIRRSLLSNVIQHFDMPSCHMPTSKVSRKDVGRYCKQLVLDVHSIHEKTGKAQERARGLYSL